MYYGFFNLDKLHNSIKIINWIICFILTVLLTIVSLYIHTSSAPPYIYKYIRFIALISPAFILATWLRITGISWRYIMLFLLLVPITSSIIDIIINSVGYILMAN